MQRYLLTFFVLLMVFSCGNEQKKTNQEPIQKEKKIKVTKSLYDFSPSAFSITEEWTAFKFLRTKINQIIAESDNNAIEVIQELDKAILDVEKSIPEKIQNTSLNARLTVLKTQVGLYKDVVQNNLATNKEHVTQIHHIIDAFNHCVFQINDIVEKRETEERYKNLQ